MNFIADNSLIFRISLMLVNRTIQGIYLFWGSEKRKMYSGDIYFGFENF